MESSDFEIPNFQEDPNSFLNTINEESAIFNRIRESMKKIGDMFLFGKPTEQIQNGYFRSTSSAGGARKIKRKTIRRRKYRRRHSHSHTSKKRSNRHRLTKRKHRLL